MWERGLKLKIYKTLIKVSLVAPHVGAWIETITTHLKENTKWVAPHVGAWIET